MNHDAQRFEKLYDDYSGHILAYAARRTSQLSDAADIAAETFSVAWRRIDDAPPGEDARPWLYGIARNVVSNHHRSTTRRMRLSAKITTEVEGMLRKASTDPAFVQHIIDSGDGVTASMISTALQQLPPNDQELLRLIAWEECSPQEAAEALQCSLQTLRVRLHRARQRFSVFLDQARRQQLAYEHRPQPESESNHRPQPESVSHQRTQPVLEFPEPVLELQSSTGTTIQEES